MKKLIILFAIIFGSAVASAQARKNPFVGFWKLSRNDGYTLIYEITDHTFGIYGTDIKFEYTRAGNAAKMVSPDDGITTLTFKLRGKDELMPYEGRRDKDSDVAILTRMKMEPPAATLVPGKYCADVVGWEPVCIVILENGDAQWPNYYSWNDRIIPFKYLIDGSALYLICVEEDLPISGCLSGEIIDERSFLMYDNRRNHDNKLFKISSDE